MRLRARAVNRHAAPRTGCYNPPHGHAPSRLPALPAAAPQLDLIGPWEVLSRVPGAELHLLARELAPVGAEGGLTLLPTGTLADAPPLDVVCVPGGAGVNAVLEDDAALDWLAGRASAPAG